MKTEDWKNVGKKQKKVHGTQEQKTKKDKENITLLSIKAG